MIPKFFSLIILLLLLNSCKSEDLIGEFGTSRITARDKLGEVINKAKSEFSSDAALASIYGREVNSEGYIDLLETEKLSMFFYIVQSDILMQNKIYIPVYKSSPIESPLDFQTALNLIRDENVRNYMQIILGTLSTISIDPTVNYDDSNDVLSKMFNNQVVNTFRINNPELKIDMYLVPAKSIDSTFSNSADWIINFYTDSNSLVMWQHTATGEIIPLPAPEN